MVALAQVAVAYDKDETVHIIIMPSRVLVCARVSLPPTPMSNKQSNCEQPKVWTCSEEQIERDVIGGRYNTCLCVCIFCFVLLAILGVSARHVPLRYRIFTTSTTASTTPLPPPPPLLHVKQKHPRVATVSGVVVAASANAHNTNAVIPNWACATIAAHTACCKASNKELIATCSAMRTYTHGQFVCENQICCKACSPSCVSCSLGVPQALYEMCHGSDSTHCA